MAEYHLRDGVQRHTWGGRMTPAVLSHKEARAWLRNLDLATVRLPRPGKILIVDDPGPQGRLWCIRPGESLGWYFVEPLPPTTSTLVTAREVKS